MPEDAHVEPAASPAEISPRGWRELLAAAAWSWAKHRSPAAAAGAAFYVVLAVFPGVAAFGSALGLLGRPDGVERKLRLLADVLPADVFRFVAGEAPRFAQGRHSGLLGEAALFGLLCLMSASSAVRQLMVALNVAYRCEEARPWLRRRVMATVFAAGVGAGLAGEIGLLLKTDAVAAVPGLAGEGWELVSKWSVTFALSVASLALLYRYGPDRPRARWRWVTPGSLFAAGLGVATSLGVSAYLAQVAQYERTYGGLGAMLGLAVWVWTGLMTVLAGAELNYALEAKTSVETCRERQAVDGEAHDDAGADAGGAV